MILQKNRGNETQLHRQEKRRVASAFLAVGCNLVLCEHLNCDVAASCTINGKRTTLCAEVERSIRNVLRNIQRDIASGGDHIFVVCGDARLSEEVNRKLARDLSDKERGKVSVSTSDQFGPSYVHAQLAVIGFTKDLT